MWGPAFLEARTSGQNPDRAFIHEPRVKSTADAGPTSKRCWASGFGSRLQNLHKEGETKIA